MGELAAAAAEAVADEDIGAGLGIFPMNADNDLGGCQIHLLGASAGGQPAFLQQGSHGSVENQYPIF